MAVVINEFEVVGEAPPPHGAPSGSTSPDRLRTTPPDARDLQRILRLIQLEQLRVWAH